MENALQSDVEFRVGLEVKEMGDVCCYGALASNATGHKGVS